MIRRKIMSEANPLKCYFQRTEPLDLMAGYPYFCLLARKLVEKFHPSKVLDVGCAQGVLVYAFRELGVESYGVDISERLLYSSKESIRGYLNQVDVDFAPLPFEERSFDLVTACHMTQHLQRPGYLISEIWRVLRPDGIAFMSAPVLPFETSLWKSFGIQRDREHFNDHARQTWINAFELNGYIYIGNMQEVIREAFSLNLFHSSFWLAQWLRRLGPLGRKLEGQLTSILTGMLMFKKQQFHPQALELIASSGGK